MIDPPCYWIEEYGAYELCGGDLPPLVEGWIQFDSLPIVTLGRVGDATPYGNTDHPMMARPCYGAGLIVVACSYQYGVAEGSGGSEESYPVFVSDDHGATYGEFIDKYTWQAGGPHYGGYDGCGYWRRREEYHGTKISFDNTDTFYVVNTTDDNVSEFTHRTITSKSTDGVIWTTNQDNSGVHVVLDSASWDGKVWFIGTNTPDAGFSDPTLSAGYSANDGVSWTLHTFTEHEQQYSEPWDHGSFCDANAEGLHISGYSYQPGTNFFGTTYWRPLTATTWAAPLEIFDFALAVPDMQSEGTGHIVASKVTAGLVAICGIAQSAAASDEVVFRRSLDYGVTFDPLVVPFVCDVLTYGQFFRTQVMQMNVDMCQLDDGRLVIVIVMKGSHAETVNDTLMLTYVISEDYGANWSVNKLLSEDYLRGVGWDEGRVYCVAKGNDVVVTQTSRNIAGSTFIFRP